MSMKVANARANDASPVKNLSVLKIFIWTNRIQMAIQQIAKCVVEKV